MRSISLAKNPKGELMQQYLQVIKQKKYKLNKRTDSRAKRTRNIDIDFGFDESIANFEVVKRTISTKRTKRFTRT